MGSRLIGVGSYLPERILTNEELTRMVDTSDEWIRSRTGITSRRMAADDQTTSDLAANAARDALARAGIPSSSVDLIIVATVTPDRTFPSTAVYVQEKISAGTTMAFDVSAACAGFIHALEIADSFLQTGRAKTALVIGADKLSCFLDWNDRATCVLFGDGAGAFVLQADPEAETSAVLASHLSADGTKSPLLYADGGPSSTGTVGLVRMVGNELFRAAVNAMSDALDISLKRAALTPDDLDWFVPHQANIRIMHGIAERLNIPDEKVVKTIQDHGNTSSASIPLAISTAIDDGRIQDGNLCAVTAAGGGLAWGAAILRF
ncbi:ketoacyl-ACP synthase III [Labrenzia aggregata]|uniref:Beta-ketoacyl-[acyl-carrier-protein] synthase III n=1 Tax=Roseibium aggregatum TaxID=187304 RepID=A0A939EAB3_9HYPH|nr:ketoacyl-ACP synthase III [Roseibium aggregatum]